MNQPGLLMGCFSAAIVLVLQGCTLLGISEGPRLVSPPIKPVPGFSTLSRDAFGFVHVTAPDYYGAGYGVGVAQVDDYGLDLQLFWALLTPEVESLLTPAAVDPGHQPRIAHPGQAPSTLQFDSRSLPVGSARRELRAPTLEEIRLTLEYMNFHEGTNETADRLEGSLLDYLRGYVAGANLRLQQRRAEYLASTDPRIQYLVGRGLHARRVSLLDPIRAAAAQALPFTTGLVQVWADLIDSLPGPTAGGGQMKMRSTGIAPKLELSRLLARYRLPPPRHTASNEFAFSGSVTQSGRPMVMVDPHLPMYNTWLNSATSLVIQTPDIIIDATTTPGQPVPLVGHAMHPRTRSAVAINGTANSHTPSSCWFSPVDLDLSSYITSSTGPSGAPFTARTMGRLTLREAGTYGRLIAQRAVDVGGFPLQLGFLFRSAKDSKFSMIETLWPAFHAKSVPEFHAALNRHALPYWNISAAFSTPDKPSTVLYINNQVSPRRSPNPDANPATLGDWNGFMDPNLPGTNTEWSGTYHTADELPQIVAENSGKRFVHCHNCSAERVTGSIPSHPYLIGGVSGYSNARHAAGDLYYAEATANGRKISFDDAKALANDKRDLQLQEIVAKLSATRSELSMNLPPDVEQKAFEELDLWRGGSVDGSISNTRIARVYSWIAKVNTAMVSNLTPRSTDMERLLGGTIFPESEVTFSDSTPLDLDDAVLAFTQLAAVHDTYPNEFGPDTRTWGEINRFRPTIFGKSFAFGTSDFPLGGSLNALLSVGGSILTLPSGLKAYSVTGGQNYVQVIEVGARSALKRSVAGTTNPALAYSRRMSELFAFETFTPTGLGTGEMPAGRIISTERFQLPTRR